MPRSTPHSASHGGAGAARRHAALHARAPKRLLLRFLRRPAGPPTRPTATRRPASYSTSRPRTHSPSGLAGAGAAGTRRRPCRTARCGRAGPRRAAGCPAHGAPPAARRLLGRSRPCPPVPPAAFFRPRQHGLRCRSNPAGPPQRADGWVGGREGRPIPLWGRARFWAWAGPGRQGRGP